MMVPLNGRDSKQLRSDDQVAAAPPSPSTDIDAAAAAVASARKREEREITGNERRKEQANE